MPSIPGSMRSSRTRSGLYSWNADSASSPRATIRLWKPSLCSTRVSISARAASSSTTRMRARPTWSDGVTGSVSVVIGLVGTLDRNTEVVGLLLRQLGQLDAQRVEVQARDLLVEVLGQHVDADRVLLGLREQLDLGEHLVGEGVRHHERRVAGRVAEVQQPPLREHDDLLAVGEDPLVDLRLDLVLDDAGDLRQTGHVDLVVEVPDVADDRLVLHPLEVLDLDDVEVAGRGDEDVCVVDDRLEALDLVAVHR